VIPFIRDVEEKGASNEEDLFGGTILNPGKTMGLATPRTEFVYSSPCERLAVEKGSP
jgi:hypothetical protein